MRFLPITAALVVLGAGTIRQGFMSERWGAASSEKLDRFTQCVAKIPLKIADWQGLDDQLNEQEEQQQRKEFAESHCTAYISRTYTNGEGERVNLYLVSGTARNVTIHTPDWCYVGAGYRMLADPQQYPVRDVPGVDPDPEFLTTMFLKETPVERHMIRIFWSFSDDGVWHGPRIAKGSFAGRPALYKVYLITDLSGAADEDPARDPALRFIKDFIPVANQVLFAPDETNERTAASK